MNNSIHYLRIRTKNVYASRIVIIIIACRAAEDLPIKFEINVIKTSSGFFFIITY